MVEIKVKLKPFLVPNFVVMEQAAKPKQDGFQNSRGIPLSDIDEETLLKMCADFKRAVLAKHKGEKCVHCTDKAETTDINDKPSCYPCAYNSAA